LLSEFLGVLEFVHLRTGKIRKHKFSEIDGRKTAVLLVPDRLALSKGLIRAGFFHDLRMETGPVSETSSFLISYNSGRWTKPGTPIVLGVIYHRQKPFGLHLLCQEEHIESSPRR
jgi:hypothetical protein